jgi:hypothetical protein
VSTFTPAGVKVVQMNGKTKRKFWFFLNAAYLHGSKRHKGTIKRAKFQTKENIIAIKNSGKKRHPVGPFPLITYL